MELRSLLLFGAFDVFGGEVLFVSSSERGSTGVSFGREFRAALGGALAFVAATLAASKELLKG